MSKQKSMDMIISEKDDSEEEDSIDNCRQKICSMSIEIHGIIIFICYYIIKIIINSICSETEKRNDEDKISTLVQDEKEDDSSVTDEEERCVI